MDDFHVGQQVVCVDARGQHGNLREGATYVVDRVYRDDGDDFIALIGVANERAPKDGMFAHRFKPLEEKPDAIEVFRQIARDVTAGKVRKLVGA